MNTLIRPRHVAELQTALTHLLTGPVNEVTAVGLAGTLTGCIGEYFGNPACYERANDTVALLRYVVATWDASVTEALRARADK